MKVLITGVTGFIGYNLANRLLLEHKYEVYGIDNLNNNTNQRNIKIKRLKQLNKLKKNFYFTNLNINNKERLNSYIQKNKFSIFVHLAAEAGVRNSFDNPINFFETNVKGFFNVLHCSKENKIKHLIYASSSSVYGNTNIFPQNEIHNTDNPESIYAATKKTNEILAYAYSKNYGLKSTGLRFFTVYGPYGREDMALYKFTDAIINNKTIHLFNSGNHYRDFTYIDDAIDAIIKIILNKKKRKNLHEIYNIGKGRANNIKEYINKISKVLNKKPKIKNTKFQKGDVYKTLSDIKKIKKDYKYHPKTNIYLGIKKYIKWFKDYY